MHLLSVGLVRATGLSLAEAGSGLSFPKGERGAAKEAAATHTLGEMSLKGYNLQSRARHLNRNCQDGKCIKSH